jgi:hypothetical protein
VFTQPHGYRCACFDIVASATFTGNALDVLCRMLRISFRPDFREPTPKNVFRFEHRPNVTSIL